MILKQVQEFIEGSGLVQGGLVMWSRPFTDREMKLILIADVLVLVLMFGGTYFVRHKTDWCEKITNHKLYSVCAGHP